MSLRQKVLAGFFWISGMRLIGQLFTWSVTIIVIRLLSPGDYGLLAMAMVVVGFVLVMAEAGLGAAVVQARELDEVSLRATFGAVIVVNVSLWLVLLVSAALMAEFFNEPKLVPIIRVQAFQLLIAIFAVVPHALLARAMDFKRPSMIGFAGALCASLTTLALALSGHGVWALVVGNLAGYAFTTVAINFVSPFLKRPMFSLAAARPLILFGGQLTGSRILSYCYSQADMLIAGRLLGRELLGLYSVAMHLGSLPVQKIAPIINAVAFPAFARTQDDPRLVSMYLLKALRVLSVVAFPVLWGISSIAPEIVMVLLGSKWERAAIPLQLLPLVLPFTMYGSFLNTALQGIGRGGMVFNNVLTACLIMPVAFWIGARSGLLGLSVAWLIAYPVVLTINLRRGLPVLGLAPRDLFRATGRAGFGACGMYAAVSAVRYLVAGGLDAPLRMALLIVTGATAYGILAMTTNGGALREIKDLLLGGAKAPAPRSKTT